MTLQKGGEHMINERYAIISDIHGNFPALSAVLADAKTQGATKYLFLGDYANGNIFGNEVTEAIRGLDNAVVICGNHEGFLHWLKNNPADFVDHSGLAVWNSKNLKPDNLNYLLGLPDTAVVSEKGLNIYLNHHLHQIKDIFFPFPNFIKPMHSVFFREMFEESPITHDDFLRFAKDAVLSDPSRVDRLKALPDGIYLFGHSHIQFHMEFERKLFINPGSCGEALDGNPTAAYTLFENGSVFERRVEYDVSKSVAALRQSDYYTNNYHNSFWAELEIKNITTGFDYFRSFYSIVKETIKKRKENGVASHDCILEAIKIWENQEK
jgi:predicted phosphodiesterase